jgi:hypothetical protein
MAMTTPIVPYQDKKTRGNVFIIPPPRAAPMAIENWLIDWFKLSIMPD